jgi:hypothetical protein
MGIPTFLKILWQDFKDNNKSTYNNYFSRLCSCVFLVKSIRMTQFLETRFINLKHML